MTSLVVLVAVFGAMTFLKTEAVNHIVGDSTGWQTPTDPNFYTNWASSQTFSVGDTLTFNFVTGVHAVATASQTDYNNCNTGINSVQRTGPATITLNSAGPQYYYCTFSNHCSSGQKLAINVGGSTSYNPSLTPPPPPGTASTLNAAFTSVIMLISMVIALLLS